jgi:hypothetical protein
MAILPEGFEETHLRGNESHRLNEDRSKRQPQGIGEESDSKRRNSSLPEPKSRSSST